MRCAEIWPFEFGDRPELVATGDHPFLEDVEVHASILVVETPQPWPGYAP